MEFKTAALISCWTHLVVCLALTIVSFGQVCGSTGMRRIRRPLLLVATFTALWLGMLVLVAWSFSAQGGINLETVRFRIHGAYGWIYIGLLTLPFMPLIGLAPSMEKHPWIHMGLSVVAMAGAAELIAILA